MKPNGGGEPTGDIRSLIEKKFTTFENFKNEFSNQSISHFGSGWIWLVQKDNNQLEIMQGHDANNPIKNGDIPLLTIDVWEHAYYLDKQNARPEYIKSIN